MKRRHVLVVAWWFPPLSGGGVHRPLQFVRHLVRRNFRVSVLTGVPPAGERLDAELAARVPSEARVIRAPLLDPFRFWSWLKGGRGRAPETNGAAHGAEIGAGRPRLRDLITRAIALPDRFMPWIAPAALRAALALRGDEPELVFSTSPPHSVHLVGHALAGLFGAPHVVDFRDPWLGNPFNFYPTPLFRRIDAALEERVVDGAAQVILNTPALEREFRRRHPGSRVRTITNGFDPDAFSGLPEARGGGSPGAVEIAHFGQLYGMRSGRFLLEGLAELRRVAPQSAARVKVRFFGSIDGEAAFLARAKELGVGDAISSEGALPHRDALARQRRSDVLLLLGPETREPEVQVPGKLYEYLAAERPILVLSRRGGAIAEVLAGAGVACERAEPDSPPEIAAALAREIDRAGRTDRCDDDARRRAIESFRYDRLGERLIGCFDDAWLASAER